MSKDAKTTCILGNTRKAAKPIYYCSPVPWARQGGQKAIRTAKFSRKLKQTKSKVLV